MLCEKCKKNTATTYIKTLVNGKYSEKHLCSECYMEENNFVEEKKYYNESRKLATRR